MKHVFRILFAAALVSLATISCKDEKEETDITPLISDLSAENHDDSSSQVKRGGNIGVSFDVVSRSGAKLDYYHIEIHDHPTSGLITDEYRIIDSTFQNQATFKNLKNAHVHQHISVPQIANLGSYHIVVVAVDADGNSADTENGNTHIEVIE